MKNLRSLSMYLFLTMIATSTMNIVSFEPTLHRVGGGKYTWRPDVNFTDWSSKEHFVVGDWLYFGFDRTQHNVLQVNKTAYEGCIETGFISNVTRGGRDVFQLVQTKPYYFICSRGFCQKGMKVAVVVLPQPPPSSPIPHTPPHTASAAAPRASAAAAFFVFLAFVLS